MKSALVKNLVWIVVIFGCKKPHGDDKQDKGSAVNVANDVGSGSAGSGSAASGSAGSGSAGSGSATEGMCVKPMKICPPECPDNSPIVNTFPINGIAADGKGGCSAEAVQVMTGSLQGGGCKGTFNLTVDKDFTKLVGVNDSGSSCEGKQLIGATFTIRSAWVSGTVDLRIDDAKQFQPDEGSGSGSAATPLYWGYRVVRATNGSNAAKKSTPPQSNSLCDMDRANEVRSALGIGAQPTYQVKGITESGDSNWEYATVIPGPIYSPDAKPTSDAPGKFFNLACADDALAKRTFDKLYTPTTEANGDDMNRAALRMMTANYCGKPYTTRGMRFHWEEDMTEAAMKPEARWLGASVSCLADARLMWLEKKKKQPKDLPPELLPEGCKTADGSPTTCKWPDWIKYVREECKSADPDFGTCTGPKQDFIYESYPGGMDGKGHYRRKHHKPNQP